MLHVGLPDMHNENSTNLVIEKQVGATEVRLPNRNLRPIRWVGYFIGVVALVQCVVVGMFFLLPLLNSLEQQQNGATDLMFVGLGVIFFIPIGLQFYLASLILRGNVYTQLQLVDGEIQITERFGFFTKKRKCLAEDIESLEIVTGMTREGERGAGKTRPQTVPFLQEFSHALVGKLKDTGEGSDFLLVFAYPVETLNEVGQFLNGQLGLQAESLSVEEGTASGFSAQIPIRESSVTVEVPNRLARPDSCRVVVSEHDGMTTFEIPAGGLIRGSHGLFVFAIVWNLFMGVFTYLVLADGLEGSFGVFLAFISLFWTVGITLLVTSIVLATRKTIIGVAEDRVFVQVKSWLGKKWKEAEFAEISSIAVGPSGIEVNNVPVNELQIFHKDDQKIGIGSALPDDQLRWLAGELYYQWQLRSPAT